MTGPRDVACLLFGAGAILRSHGSLGACFTAHYGRLGTVRAALGAFVDELCAPDFRAITGQRAPTRRLKHLLPHPERGSACKRLNLFLRWMVRGRTAWISGSGAGCRWRSWWFPRHSRAPDRPVHRSHPAQGPVLEDAEDVTRRLRLLDAGDPVRYDFALSHLGISGTCAARRDARRCAGCPLKPICRHWT